MNINFTNHSKVRMQQRGISKTAVEHIIKHGHCQFDGHGGKIYFIKRKDRKYQTSDLPKRKFESIKKQLNGYVVLSGNSDAVLTVGHKFRRRKN
jgi:hypothetical protein